MDTTYSTSTPIRPQASRSTAFAVPASWFAVARTLVARPFRSGADDADRTERAAARRAAGDHYDEVRRRNAIALQFGGSLIPR